MPARKGGHEVFCGNWENGVDKRCDERYNLSCVCGRSSSGRARPCQGRGSEFEPRRPLQKEYPIRQDGVFFLECAAAPENSLPRPARSASNPEVKAGLPRMALPFVGCREASSSLVYFAAQSAKNKEKPAFGRCFLFGMPRAGWNSLPRPARSSGRTAAGFRVGRPALRPPPFIAGAFVCRAANRSVGDGVPDVPSARRCRAGNGFPRRFAPRSKCPWGTDWRGNPLLKRIIPALFRRFPAKRLRIPTPVTSVTGSE